MSSVPNPFESGVKPEGGKTVIVQLSDPQFGYWSDNREMTREIEACGEAVRRINRLKPDLVVVTGDLVNRYDDAEQWRAFDSVISGLDKQIKVVCLPGNHDQKISGDKVDCTVFKEHYGADRFALALKGNLLLGNQLLVHQALRSGAGTRPESMARRAARKIGRKGQDPFHPPPLFACTK